MNKSPESYINRDLEPVIQRTLYQGKVIIIYGPRQVGKTTLVKKIISNERDARYLLCEIPEVNQILASQSLPQILALFEHAPLVVLDEAQSVSNIGRVLKLLVDTHPEVQIIATGSSSFELSNHIIEPLTGRKYEYILYPLSAHEIQKAEGNLRYQQKQEYLLRYGNYPAIHNAQSPETSESILISDIATSYLFKDILAHQNIRNSEILLRLLQMLALQIGSEISFTEIASSLGIEQTTVQRYINLLEKIFVIYRIMPFSRNLRKELNKKRKIFFYDLGIRNALINNFNPLSLRQDVGALWENYCFTERRKALANAQVLANHYFWRTWDKKEIDLIEERGGFLAGYEIKYANTKKKTKPPAVWLDTYPNATFDVVTPDSSLAFFTPPQED